MTAEVPVVPGYTELAPIGRGGVGDVYAARSSASGSMVAIKVLRDVADSSAAWRRCRRELTALVALAEHPNVTSLIDVARVGDNPVLVVEYAPGGSLAELAERCGPLDPAEGVRVGYEVAGALVAAHARGIVHRDVKPHNVLVAADGSVKLCDFGIAALTRSKEFCAATGSVSLRFASPEDLEDDAPVGPASDVYSLGATLLYLVHGRYLDLRDRLVAWEPTTQPPDPLDALIAECLAPEPEARPTASAVRARLGELDAACGRPLAGVAAEHLPLPRDTIPRPLPGHVVSAPAAPPRPSPPSHRRRARAAVAGLAALVTAGVGWWIADTGSQRGEHPERIARPAGLVALTSLGWPAGDLGECLVQARGQATLRGVACGEPHDLERVGAGRLPGGTFDAANIDHTVDAACAEVARAYAGVTPDAVGLGVAVSRPSADGWHAGDRSYQCFVGARDGRLAGSAAAD